MPIGIGAAVSPEFILGALFPPGALLWNGIPIVWGGIVLNWS